MARQCHSVPLPPETGCHQEDKAVSVQSLTLSRAAGLWNREQHREPFPCLDSPSERVVNIGALGSDKEMRLPGIEWTLQEGDALGAMEKVCRQLTYHLSPHSQWRRQGLMKRKPQACLKAILSSSPINNTVDLSGIPLTVKDMERLASFLQQNSDRVTSVELCFTELTDEAFLQLLPTLGMLPLLNTLSLNGNRLTKAVLRDLTDTLKDPEKFPSVTWIDLGNNVDIFSLPQPFLVSLRKRCPKQGNLPTILEFGESQMSDMESHDGNLSECLDDLGSEAEDSRQSPSPTSTPSQSQLVSKSEKPMGGETGDQVVMLAANQT
ncbi:leucine-rich repeat-containing protein 75A isoform X3 [Lepisosteus oculatus]|uniref:leucine-rich repeat-containing protein 75A isoform X3 n=1 Tax=Lepisosteus oculatus TaxID=7918 RepID=UPI0037166864